MWASDDHRARSSASPGSCDRGRVAVVVSIRAPRCRGAKLVRSSRGALRTRFQSALPVAGERSQLWPRRQLSLRCFNPRSPLPGSEAGWAVADAEQDVCFNPRSPLPGSEAPKTTPAPQVLPVSIRAPRCRGAKQSPKDALDNPSEVSIRAPRCRGAKHGAANPSMHDTVVSIRAPRCRGAKHARRQ